MVNLLFIFLQVVGPNSFLFGMQLTG
jgi:hypothetical protein